MTLTAADLALIRREIGAALEHPAVVEAVVRAADRRASREAEQGYVFRWGIVAAVDAGEGVASVTLGQDPSPTPGFAYGGLTPAPEDRVLVRMSRNGADLAIVTIVGRVAAASSGDGSGFANPMTAIGDLIVGDVDGAPARLGKPTGLTNPRLTVDQATGILSWTDVGSAELGTGTADATTFLRGDRTWAADPSTAPSRVFPQAWVGAANLTTQSAFASGNTYALYMGRAKTANPTIVVYVNVTTAAAGITWAELGIATGAMVSGAASLTRRAWTSVAATFDVTGAVNTALATTGVAKGDEIWVLLGSQATTPFQVRAGLANDLNSPAIQAGAGVRVSTMATPQAMARVGVAFAIPRVEAWLP